MSAVRARRPLSLAAFVVGGLVVAVALAVVLAPRADADPDGLEKVAAEHGIDANVRDHAFADGPLADYAVDGVGSSWASTALAGVIGIAITFAVGALVLVAVRRRGRRSGAPA